MREVKLPLAIIIQLSTLTRPMSEVSALSVSVKSAVDRLDRTTQGEGLTWLTLPDTGRCWEGSPLGVEGGQLSSALILLNFQAGGCPGLGKGFNDTLYVHLDGESKGGELPELRRFVYFKVDKESGIYININPEISLILIFTSWRSKS